MTTCAPVLFAANLYSLFNLKGNLSFFELNMDHDVSVTCNSMRNYRSVKHHLGGHHDKRIRGPARQHDIRILSHIAVLPGAYALDSCRKTQSRSLNSGKKREMKSRSQLFVLYANHQLITTDRSIKT